MKIIMSASGLVCLLMFVSACSTSLKSTYHQSPSTRYPPEADARTGDRRRSNQKATAKGRTAREKQGEKESVDMAWLDSVVFKRIEAGEFLMGSPSGKKEGEKKERGRDPNEGGVDGDRVSVEISRAFEMMEKEVTQSQWFSVMRENPSYFKKEGDCSNHRIVVDRRGDRVGMCPKHPVERVSWRDVKEFIRRLNDYQGLSGCEGGPKDLRGCYRLPTEAEWEYAARGGTQTAWFFGGQSRFFGDAPSESGEYAWYWKNSGLRTHEVGLKLPNPFGLYDVYGNVWEWVEDGYVGELPGGKDPFVKGDSGSFRVIRGGGWDYGARLLRSAHRSRDYPHVRSLNLGFRLVRTL